MCFKDIDGPLSLVCILDRCFDSSVKPHSFERLPFTYNVVPPFKQIDVVIVVWRKDYIFACEPAFDMQSEFQCDDITSMDPQTDPSKVLHKV